MPLTPEDEAFIKQVEEENNRIAMQGGNNQMMLPASAMFGQSNKQNLVEWQLDFRDELEDIEHLLRCDILTVDKNYGEKWETNPNQEHIFVNNLGVNDIVREIRMFLNKNTVLSNYPEDAISERVRQFSHELRSLIYNNAERYGIDNEYKQNNYAIMVITVMAMVESVYRRAINGEERRDLNSARIVQQTEQPMMQNYPPGINIYNGSQKKKHWYNPFTWGR